MLGGTSHPSVHTYPCVNYPNPIHTKPQAIRGPGRARGGEEAHHAQHLRRAGEGRRARHPGKSVRAFFFSFFPFICAAACVGGGRGRKGTGPHPPIVSIGPQPNPTTNHITTTHHDTRTATRACWGGASRSRRRHSPSSCCPSSTAPTPSRYIYNFLGS